MERLRIETKLIEQLVMREPKAGLLLRPRAALRYNANALAKPFAYPEVSAKLAMKIGDLSTLEDLKRPPWTQFAKDTGLGGAFVRRRVAELAEAVRAQAHDVAASLEGDVNTDELQRYRDIVLARAEAVGASCP